MLNFKSYGTAYATMINREFTRLIRMWQVTIFAPAISMALYFIIFGSLIGPRIGEMQGFSYTAYIAPGLIMMAVINNAYAHTSSTLYLARLQKNIEEVLIAPIPNWLFLLGYVSGGVMRGIVVGTGVTIIALFFTQLPVYNAFAIISTVLLASILFSLAGVMNSLFARSFDDISIIPTFVLTPLTYLGGVFYSVSLLPEFWRTASSFNPILYIVNTFRYGILGISDVSLSNSFILLALFIILLFAGNIYLLRKGVGIRT
ncbi:MAG: ABC transporter permease [Gammaproteobacteria bacterium]